MWDLRISSGFGIERVGQECGYCYLRYDLFEDCFVVLEVLLHMSSFVVEHQIYQSITILRNIMNKMLSTQHGRWLYVPTKWSMFLGRDIYVSFESRLIIVYTTNMYERVTEHFPSECLFRCSLVIVKHFTHFTRNLMTFYISNLITLTKTDEPRKKC